VASARRRDYASHQKGGTVPPRAGHLPLRPYGVTVHGNAEHPCADIRHGGKDPGPVPANLRVASTRPAAWVVLGALWAVHRRLHERSTASRGTLSDAVLSRVTIAGRLREWNAKARPGGTVPLGGAERVVCDHALPSVCGRRRSFPKPCADIARQSTRGPHCSAKPEVMSAKQQQTKTWSDPRKSSNWSGFASPLLALTTQGSLVRTQHRPPKESVGGGTIYLSCAFT
jgi:hypothetical protein